MTTISLGFLPRPIVVAIDKILPSRKLAPIVHQSSKFKQIKASISKVGLIEPLAVLQFDKKLGGHVLLDGHLRLNALQTIGASEVECLVANDDEAYTYNNRVNRLSSIQEHIMIRRAIERGLSASDLSEAMDIDISSIMKKRRLLDGICPEVVALLSDRTFTSKLTPILRKMKPTRQIECVELMISANNLSVSYARAMLLMTRPELMLGGKRQVSRKLADADHVERMGHEMESVSEQYRLAEQSYAEDMLNLMLARKYVDRLLQNKSVMRHLQAHHPDMLDEFAHIVQAASLDN